MPYFLVSLGLLKLMTNDFDIGFNVGYVTLPCLNLPFSTSPRLYYGYAFFYSKNSLHFVRLVSNYVIGSLETHELAKSLSLVFMSLVAISRIIWKHSLGFIQSLLVVCV